MLQKKKWEDCSHFAYGHNLLKNGIKNHIRFTLGALGMVDQEISLQERKFLGNIFGRLSYNSGSHAIRILADR